MTWAPDPRSPIKVILIDDHFLIHEAVASLLAHRGEFELVAKGTAGKQIQPLIEQYHPDVVLLDINIPAQPGTTIRHAGRFQTLPAIRRLRQKHPQTQLVILSTDANRYLIEAALEAGARGYLLKDDELSLDLPDAIRAVHKGGVYFSKEVARQVVLPQPEYSDTGITDRQVQVLQYVISNANLSYAEHARNMGIAENTFRNHLRAIFAKLGASNLTYAIVRAIQLGIIPTQLLSPAAEEGIGD